MIDIGEVMQAVRKKNGYTQQQVADKLDVSLTAVGGWENGYKLPGTKMLVELSKLYHVPLDYLAGVDTKEAVTLDGLTQSQKTLIHCLVQEFESEKTSVKGLTERQKDLLSDLIAELS